MYNTLLLLSALLFLILQSTLFQLIVWAPLQGAVPSLVFPLILFIGVHEHSLARGAALSFIIGYTTDLIGIAPIGLFSSTYVAIFLLARAIGLRFATQTALRQMGLTFPFTLAHSGLIIILLAIFGRDAYVPRTLYRFIFPHAVATSFISPFVFRFAQFIYITITPFQGNSKRIPF
ncbi:hypothetical protein [Pajaroellobacter abortibovis]|uniref:Rod shape-determining protein MreD n=1 Tax=Pajaroellobacter abortibovis TaxID=1882918 RepID=A0A1L6MVD0_9BACT|nr:hypothetical protein [Pajaroellobacter abortibovis]APR99472.1 hypothetical protein BCY86_01340 [Pajaroellobacter abortibovis]